MKKHLHWNIYDGCVTELYTIEQLLLHVRVPKWLPQDFRLMFCKSNVLRPLPEEENRNLPQALQADVVVLF